MRSPAGRVIVLAVLSELLPASTLAVQLARDLGTQTGSSVALVQLLPSAGCGGLDSGAGFDRVLDGVTALPIELPPVYGGLSQLRLGINGEVPPSGAFVEWFNRLRERFAYVLVQVEALALSPQVVGESIRGCDQACLFTRPTTGDAYQIDLLIRGMVPADDGRCLAKFKPVVCLARDEVVGDFDSRLERIGVTSPTYVRGCPLRENANSTLMSGEPSGSFGADLRRLARDLGGCLIGLALSSGGAKGLAHIGVIQVLEENGVEVDVIAGSSMGAYVGALWAYGCDGRKLELLAREVETPFALWKLVDPAFPPRRGFLRGLAVKRRFMRTIGRARFADLVRPLRVVAADLETLDRVVFSSGPVGEAVHASIAVPGIVVPVDIGDRTYIDGGVVDPLPVDVLREMGVTRIIAVNTIPTPDRIREFLRVDHELAQHPKRRARKILRNLFPIERELNYFARGNILEILMRSIHGAQIRVAEASCRRADLVLRPDVCDDRWVDYRNPGRYITRGRLVAAEHLDEILALTRPKPKTDEHQTAPVTVGGFA